MNDPSKRDESTVLNHLRSDPTKHARSLARVLVSELLAARPMAEVDVEAHARLLAQAIRAAAADPGLERWFEDKASTSLRDATEEMHGPLRDHLPSGLMESWERCVARPYRVDPSLVSSVLRDPRVHEMLRKGLQEFLTGFGQSLLASLPSPSRAGALAGIMDMARGMATVVRAEMDRQLEGRVKDFVNETLGRGIDKWTQRLATAESAKRMAESRAQLLAVLLDQPARHYLAIPMTADVAAVSRAMVEELRLLAAWDGLEQEISSCLTSLLLPLREQTLEQALQDSGLLESFRPAVEEILGMHLARLFSSEGFGGWLVSLEQTHGTVKKRRAGKTPAASKKT